ncbi:MAG: glucosidase [Thermoflavifilum sp.]|nr:glucosidase [Thermoflavifilum sp.]
MTSQYIIQSSDNEESRRLQQNALKQIPLPLWGPYLSERAWGTVREDYSPYGTAWDYFPHDHARSRAYRWGEDGIAGISDYNQLLCFAFAFWNGKDPILKERLFGLNNREGNHGEDVKELYYYLDNLPSHSYMQYLYKYPQQAYPYDDLLKTNGSRNVMQPEYEILDSGIFDDHRYFDILITYAKYHDTDLVIELAVTNRYHEAAELFVLPTLWFRNQWAFDPDAPHPHLQLDASAQPHRILCRHPRLGDYAFYFPESEAVFFTENETNTERLFQYPNASPFVKDAFHEALIHGRFRQQLSERGQGTKCSPLYHLQVEAGHTHKLYFRLCAEEAPPQGNPLDAEALNALIAQRKAEADAFYQQWMPDDADTELAAIVRQAFAGLLWNKQFYHYDVSLWLDGDPLQPPPPPQRKQGRNHNWRHLNNHDVLSMPDKWEYPWYAAWDLAFHCVAMAMIDPVFAKHQLILITREWYMHPNGQIPAYEWNFSDVNPPVQAWAALQIYRIERSIRGEGDIDFLKRIFQKLMLNFTWWVNRKDANGNNIFEGGFLGLDNISLFDRTQMHPEGGLLEQADGTSWMGMYALNMMEMALEIAQYDPAFEDVATKFYEHFVYIADSLHSLELWNEEDGFFYDVLSLPDGQKIPLRVRSIVGLTALFATSIINTEKLQTLKDFHRRVNWFREYRRKHQLYLPEERMGEQGKLLLSLVQRERLIRLLRYVLDEAEFLSPAGIRSISQYHRDHPFCLTIDGKTYCVDYEPGESTTKLFGGNSNWRGPVWMPINYLLIESLQNYDLFYGDGLQVEFPTGSGQQVPLREVARQLALRLIGLFRRTAGQGRKIFGPYAPFYEMPENQHLLLFHEYFHGDTGQGLGASHQTGWTALIATLIQQFGWDHA